MSEIVRVKDLDPTKINRYTPIKELVAITQPVSADNAGGLTCYVCCESDYAVLYLGDDWYICAQCLFNGVREGYFRLVHQGQQDEPVTAPPEKPVFNEDGTTSIGDLTVAWE